MPFADGSKHAKDILTRVSARDQWQIGKHHVFLKDEVFNHLEMLRDEVIERAISNLQSFIKYENAKKAWLAYQNSIVETQALIRGCLGRVLVSARRIQIKCEDSLTQAIADHDLVALENALQLCDRVDGIDEQLRTQAVQLVRQMEKEEALDELLRQALSTRLEKDLQHAVAEARQFETELPPESRIMYEEAEALLDAIVEMQNQELDRAAQIEKAKREIQDAINSREIGEEKRRILMVAIQNAESTEYEDDCVDDARDLLEQVVEDCEMEAALAAAIDKRNKAILQDAIKQAKASGRRLDNLPEAEGILDHLLAEEAAERQVEAALKTGNEEKIAEATLKAEAAGVTDASAVIKGAKDNREEREAKKATTKLATKAGKREYLAAMAGMTYVERMQELLKQFDRLIDFDGLRTKQMSLNFTKIPIKKPMLKYTEDDFYSVAQLEQRAVALFQNVLGYMGDRKIQYPEMVVVELLQEGLARPQLVDEIYLQVMKQCTRNTTSSLRRGWQLIGFCAETFAPSNDLLPYVDVFLYKGCLGTTFADADRDYLVSLAQAAVRYLEIRVAEGPATSALTKEEIAAQRMERKLSAKVYFTDHSVKSFDIDEAVTIAQLKEMVSVELGITNLGTYALMDLSNVADPVCLDASMKVLEVMRSWQSPTASSRETGQKRKKSRRVAIKKPKVGVHRLMFAKRLWTNLSEIPVDTVELHLMYSQTRGYVVHGKCVRGLQFASSVATL
jgi:hypothetical protein